MYNMRFIYSFSSIAVKHSRKCTCSIQVLQIPEQ